MTPEEANNEVIKFETLLPLKPDVTTIYQQWRLLLVKYNVQGVNIHDARLTAAVIAHELTHVLTFNVRDFKRYSEIIVVHPDNVDE